MGSPHRCPLRFLPRVIYPLVNTSAFQQAFSRILNSCRSFLYLFLFPVCFGCVHLHVCAMNMHFLRGTLGYLKGKGWYWVCLLYHSPPNINMCGVCVCLEISSLAKPGTLCFIWAGLDDWWVSRIPLPLPSIAPGLYMGTGALHTQVLMLAKQVLLLPLRRLVDPRSLSCLYRSIWEVSMRRNNPRVPSEPKTVHEMKLGSS